MDELRSVENRETIKFPSKDTIEDIFIKHNFEIEGDFRQAIDHFLYYVDHREPIEKEEK